MSLMPIQPRRPLEWPELVSAIAAYAPDAARLYLVGGVVRDALRGAAIHDYDLATPDDGLQAARVLADALGGAYYPVDPVRRTGRVVLPSAEPPITIDVASFRGDGLFEDLAGRDFTVNAMAVQLDQTDQLIDPLGGQHDLFDERVLRQCSPTSISSDPIRALRAVRQSIQLDLHLEATTKAAAKEAGSMLAGAQALFQPERARDELIRMLAGGEAVTALRLLHALGLLVPLCPFPNPPPDVLERRLAVVRHMERLLAIISPARDDHTAAELLLGVAVMVLDRYRRQLQEHLGQVFADGRPLPAIALLGAFTPPDIPSPGDVWGSHLRLSNAEAKLINALGAARAALPIQPPIDARQIHRYFRTMGEAGVTGVLLTLAEQLASRQPGDARPEAWGDLLEKVAAPLLDAFFRRHQHIIAPPPLLDGHTLMARLSLTPGPHVGAILERLLEEQAAGMVRTRREALALAKRLADEWGVV